MLLGNECNISEAHEGCRVNYGRELLPGAVTGGGHLVAVRPDCPETAVSWIGLLPSSTSTRPPSWCLVLRESPYQVLWPALPSSVLPASGPRLLKLRGKGLGKQLSGQIKVLCFEPGSRFARRSKPTARVVSLWRDVRERYVYYAHLNTYLLSVFCRWGTSEVL